MDRMWNYGSRVWHFWRWVGKEFIEDRCFTRASSLTYSTLLALVPLTVVIFAALRFSPFFTEITERVQSFVFSNFVPSSGQVVQQYLNKFATQALQLPVLSFVFLILTAITIMISLEYHLNDIWKVKYSRRLSGSILLYWAMLTLGPLLLGAGLLASTYIGTSHWFDFLILPDLHNFEFILPFICTVLGFGFLYMAVPHCTVKLRHAASGALIAAVLFEISKHIFAFYVFYFPTYAQLYGAMATIPLFLIWVYFAWVIFLFGAEVVNGLRLHQAERSEIRTFDFLLAYRLMGHFWEAQKKGKGLLLTHLLVLEPHCPVSAMKQVLSKLASNRFIYSNEENYLLSADLHVLSLYEFYVKLESYLPVGAGITEDNWQNNLAKILNAVNAQHQECMKTPLAELFNSGTSYDANSTI